MKHVVIGTAGHIDHGKTTLIRALTGRSTDRLKEEIMRGISIDLGFTYFDLPGGRRAGIIDVPGHERFIKNMIAGAGGIDIVLLAVAADDGVKPQTLEHAEIVSFLGVREGLIVMTKSDANDELLRELAADEIREKLAGTFFADKEIIAVDSINGFGLDLLTQKIDMLTQRAKPRDTTAKPRLHIDRAFTVKGFGTVVTGTLAEGQIHKNDEIYVYSAQQPDALAVKVKNIQVHDVNMQAVYAGQRAALNLTGAKASALVRGDILAEDGSVVRTEMADAQITLTRRAGITLKRWDRLRIYIGAREMLARFVPFTQDGEGAVNPGETAFCQLRFEQTAFLQKGDLFVMRRYSPMETIGGGVVVDPEPRKRSRTDTAALNDLASRLDGTDTDVTERCLRGVQGPIDCKTLSTLSAQTEERTAVILTDLIAQGAAYRLSQLYIHCETLNAYRDTLLAQLTRFHNENPLLPGMPKEALRSKAALPVKPRDFEVLTAVLSHDGSLQIFENIVALFGFTPRYTEKQKQIHDRLDRLYLDAGFTPPDKSQAVPDKAVLEVFNAMAKHTLIPLSDEVFIHTRHMEAARGMIREYCKQHGALTLAAFRDMTRSSRKYCLLILEHFDQRRFTRREGDARVLRQADARP